MHVARKWTILLILAYALFTVGVFFHSHTSGPQNTAKCQICQHSQVDQDQIVVADYRVVDHDCGLRIIEAGFVPTVKLSMQYHVRAPPSC